MRIDQKPSEADESRVFVVDDDQSVRESIAYMLKVHDLDHMLFESPVALLERVNPSDRGCLLLDVRMPEMNGLELFDTLKEAGISMPAIFISGHGDIQIAVRAVQAGALDFLEKPFDDEQLIEKIRNALELDAAEFREHSQHAAIEERLDALTPREREVMEGILEGKLNKLVADDLDISVRTVEIHRAKVLKKLDARNSSEMVRMVLSTKRYRDWLL